MNNITIHGRITKDPETRSTNSDKTVCNFTVAVNRRFKRDESDFFDCQAWGKTGELVQNYFTKGKEIVVQGAMQCRKWQNKEGNNRYSWELVADCIDFCGGKSDNAETNKPTNNNDFAVIDDSENFAVIDDSEDLPF